MNRVIWKYDVELADRFRGHLPSGAQFLAVQVQHGRPQMWWLVDPSAPSTAHRFALHDTGDAVGAEEKYLGTFQMIDGARVFHLFEETR